MFRFVNGLSWLHRDVSAGYSSVLPKSEAALVMTLKLNGYSTAQFGKCHEVPVWQTSPLGPFDQWPTGGGFEYFYGFHRRRDQPVVSSHLRGHDADGAGQDPRGGLPLHRGHDEQGNRVDSTAESVDA